MRDGLPTRDLARRLLAQPAALPTRLVAMAVEQLADGARRRVDEARRRGSADVERLADQIVDATIRRARQQGAAAGAALTWAEATSAIGSAGTLTLPAATVGLAADLLALAWVQARMVLELAAAYGRDMDDHEALRRDLLALQDPGDPAGKGVGKGVRSLARMVGVRTTRKLAGRVLPVVNIALNARSNARATAALADRARVGFRAGR